MQYIVFDSFSYECINTMTSLEIHIDPDMDLESGLQFFKFAYHSRVKCCPWRRSELSKYPLSFFKYIYIFNFQLPFPRATRRHSALCFDNKWFIYVYSMFMEFTQWLLLTFFLKLFRYYVRQSKRDDKLPPHYPISGPAQHLLSQLLSLVLDKPWTLNRLFTAICLTNLLILWPGWTGDTNKELLLSYNKIKGRPYRFYTGCVSGLCCV